MRWGLPLRGTFIRKRIQADYPLATGMQVLTDG